jgi:cytochrome P450
VWVRQALAVTVVAVHTGRRRGYPRCMATTTSTDLPRASAGDTALVAAEVLLPLVARGVIARRPSVVRLQQLLDADTRAVRRLERVRQTYGPGPVVLSVPGRTLALVLDPDDVHRVLDGTPEPFATANREKRAALAHFQPHGALISDPAERAHRRPFNEQVLDEPQPLHRFADRFVTVIDEEAVRLLAELRPDRTLDWDTFVTAWWYVVRRVVLGDTARGDHALTDLLTELRRDANWSYLKPARTALRTRFLRQLEAHLERAEDGSLVHLAATIPAEPGTDRLQQVPQWLFAFGPAGMAAFRALALLAAHPEYQANARAQVVGTDRSRPAEHPMLRAAVLESLRLWPTTPAILRDTTEPTTWDGATLESGAAVLVFTPLFHRHSGQAWAHRFAPELWLADARGRWPLVPFSDGPAVCPGRNLVEMTTSSLLAALLAEDEARLDPPEQLNASAPMPGTLSPFHLRFRLLPR